MLSIRVNSQNLDILDDFSITLNLKSPIFNDLGDYSFPFKVPATLNNKAILGWKDHIGSAKDHYITYPGMICWNTSIIFQGQLFIKEANKDTYEGVFYVNKGSFNYATKNVFLNRIDFGRLVFATEDLAMAYYNWSLDKFYPEVNFSLPYIKNIDFFDPAATDPELWAYNVIFGDGKIHKMTTDGQNRTIIVAFPFLRFILQQAVEKLGYTLKDEFFNSRTELSRLVIYNSFNLNENEFTLRYPHNSLLLPEIKMSDFIAGLEKWFNCCFHVDLLKKQVRIIGNEDTLMKSRVNNFIGNILSISQEIPEKTNSLLFQMTTDTGDKVMSARLDNEKETLDHIRYAYENLTDVPYSPFRELNDVYYITKTNTWYQWKEVGGIYQWVVLTLGPVLTDRFYFKLGEKSDSINTEFSTLDDINGEVSCGNLGTDKKDITPRLFWVNNLDISGNPANLHGSAHSNSFSLRYPGSTGVFNTFWGRWAEWLTTQRKSVKIEAFIDFAVIKEIDFSQRYHINGINYLISEVSVTLCKNRIKPATLKCFTCP